MSKASWDTRKAQSMWEAGYSDKDIAQEVGTTVASISYYRRKHWVDNAPPKGEWPDGTEEYDTNEAAEPDTGKERIECPELVCDEGSEMCDDRSEPEHRRGSEGKQMNRFEVMAAATAGLDGVRAVCVAEAISALWTYTDVNDLMKAKSAIEYLLQMEG